MRTRRSWRNQERLFRELFGLPKPKPWRTPRKRIPVAGPVPGPWVPLCGCPVNAPEADCKVYPCPCGAHCQECKVPA